MRAPVKNSKEVARLIEDMEYIKEAVKRNRPLFREIFAARNFRAMSLLFGVGVIVLSLSFQLFIGRFGSFAAVPVGIKAGLFAAVAAAAAWGGLMKIIAILRPLNRIDPRLRFAAVFREFFITAIFHVYIPVLLIGLAISVYLGLTAKGYYIIGTIGLTMGVLLNMLGSSIRTSAYYVLGYWLIAAAALSFFFTGISGGVWCALIFGGAFIAFVLALDLQKRREGSNGEGRR